MYMRVATPIDIAKTIDPVLATQLLSEDAKRLNSARVLASVQATAQTWVKP
jgi:hypothetical protein